MQLDVRRKKMFPESKLTAAAYLFESAHGNELGSFELSEILAAGLNGADPAVVASDIHDTLENAPGISAAYRSGAFWALGKRFDPALIPFLRQHLFTELERDMNVAYQIMIALDNLEEPVWPAHWSSRSFSDHHENLQFASEYLSRHG